MEGCMLHKLKMKHTMAAPLMDGIETKFRALFGEEQFNIAESFLKFGCSLRAQLENKLKILEPAPELQIYKRYLHFLVEIEKLFALDERSGQPICTFRWSDTLSNPRDFFSCPFLFEKASVIFNIAVIHVNMAVTMYVSIESTKDCVAKLQNAAATFSYLRDLLSRHRLTVSFRDLSPSSLSMLSMICQLQGQMMLLEAAISRQAQHILLSKMSAAVWSLSLRALQQAVSSNIEQDESLKYFLNLTKKLYSGLAHYYKALVEWEEVKQVSSGYGALICRFRAAFQALNDFEVSTHTYLQSGQKNVKQILRFIEHQINTLSYDNNRIYFESVPDLASLIALESLFVMKTSSIEIDELYEVDETLADTLGKLVPHDLFPLIKQYYQEHEKALHEAKEEITVTEDCVANSNISNEAALNDEEYCWNLISKIEGKRLYGEAETKFNELQKIYLAVSTWLLSLKAGFFQKHPNDASLDDSTENPEKEGEHTSKVILTFFDQIDEAVVVGKSTIGKFQRLVPLSAILTSGTHEEMKEAFFSRFNLKPMLLSDIKALVLQLNDNLATLKAQILSFEKFNSSESRLPLGLKRTEYIAELESMRNAMKSAKHTLSKTVMDNVVLRRKVESSKIYTNDLLRAITEVEKAASDLPLLIQDLDKGNNFFTSVMKQLQDVEDTIANL